MISTAPCFCRFFGDGERQLILPVAAGAEAVRSFETCRFTVRVEHPSSRLVVHSRSREIVILNTAEQVTVGLLAATLTIKSDRADLLEEEY